MAGLSRVVAKSAGLPPESVPVPSLASTKRRSVSSVSVIAQGLSPRESPGTDAVTAE